MADDGGDAGGSGRNSGSEQGTVLSSAASTISQLSTIVSTLEKLDDVTARSVVCEIDNVSGHALTFASKDFDHGNLGPDLPPNSIADQSSGMFSARSSGLLTGVQGQVTFAIDDGRGSTFTVNFDNPELGTNSSDCRVDGAISNAYFSNSVTGNGNHGAHIRFLIGHLNPPFSLRAFLRNTKPEGFEQSAPSTSVRSLKVASDILAAGKLSVRTVMKV